jgi:hypothetical protein
VTGTTVSSMGDCSGVIDGANSILLALPGKRRAFAESTRKSDKVDVHVLAGSSTSVLNTPQAR